jgi:hypothetical protein
VKRRPPLTRGYFEKSLIRILTATAILVFYGTVLFRVLPIHAGSVAVASLWVSAGVVTARLPLHGARVWS